MATNRHYIKEWAEARGFRRQADLLRALQEAGAELDKATISRWYSAGRIPEPKQQDLLVQVLALTEPAALFRHPKHEQFFEHLAGRDDAEIDRMFSTLEVAFPRRVK